MARTPNPASTLRRHPAILRGLDALVERVAQIVERNRPRKTRKRLAKTA